MVDRRLYCIVLFYITGQKNLKEQALCNAFAAIMLAALIREFNNYFIDIGIPEDYAKAQGDFKKLFV